MPTKTCTKCGSSKELDDFFKDKSGAQGRKARCKACMVRETYAWRAANPGGHAAVQRRYAASNPEKVSAAARAWYEVHGKQYERERYKRRQNNPAQKAVYRRGQQAAKARRRATGPISAATVREVLSHPCAYCGGTSTQVEHILPSSRGGTNARENLAPACAPCNQSKASKTPAEWRAHAKRTPDRRGETKN